MQEPPPGTPVSWENVAADTALSRGPCWLYGVLVSSGASLTATIRDGVNANGRIVLELRTVGAISETVAVWLAKPLYLHNGLFVDLSAAAQGALVAWIPEPFALAGGLAAAGA